MSDLAKLILKLQLEAKYQKEEIESKLKPKSKTKIKNSKKFVSTQIKSIKEKAVNLKNINSQKFTGSNKINLKNSAKNKFQTVSNKTNFSSVGSVSTISNFSGSSSFPNGFLSDKKFQPSQSISVVVKSNYTMAGRFQNGRRVSTKAVKSLSTASIDYISNHGNLDLENREELSSLYNSDGERLSKEELKELKKEIYQDKELTAMRRIVISPKEDISREDMKDLTREIMKSFEEQTDKNLNYHFAIHTDTEHIHSHVVITGTNRDINFTKEQLQTFREISQEKTLEITKEKEVELEKDLHLKQTREIEL